MQCLPALTDKKKLTPAICGGQLCINNNGFVLVLSGGLIFFQMVFDGSEGFGTDHVLDPAGIIFGSLRIHTEGNQHPGQDTMAFVNGQKLLH